MIHNRRRLMGGHQYGASPVKVSADERGYQGDTCAVEIRKRFIEYPQRRLGQHDSRHGKPSSLPCRVERSRLIRRGHKPDTRQRVVNFGSLEPPPQPDFEGEVFARSQFRFKSVAVGEVTQVCPVGIAVRSDRSAAPGHTPLLRRQEPGEHAQQSRLSRAIRARDMNAIAGGGLDGNSADHLAVAAPDMDIVRGKS